MRASGDFHLWKGEVMAVIVQPSQFAYPVDQTLLVAVTFPVPA